ncbi:MAG: hypothetical protein HY675_29170 [Chloroflexi bacterium]|nr:hypothetical protein [Chloroflexota bacterium]
MLNPARDRMMAYLTAHGIGVLSVSGGQEAWATPVRYRAEGLDVNCLVPRWADVAYHLEQNSGVLLVILHAALAGPQRPLCWLEYRGTARPIARPNWAGLLPDGTSEALAEDLYLVVNVSPKRIDLLDESRGWGVRETLEV